MPLHIICQDITKIPCDAIVNPTNSNRRPGGGTDEAIHTAAGPKLAEACRKLPGCEVGQAVITPAFLLPCQYVIHTVCPIWQDGTHGETALLEACYTESLKTAKACQCQSVAIPLLSSGIYGYPKDRLLNAAINAIRHFLFENEMTVTVTVSDKEAFALSQELWIEVTSYLNDRYIGEEDFPIRSKQTERNAGRRRKQAASCKSTSFMPEEDACSMQADTCAPFPSGTIPTPKTVTLDERLRNMDKGFAETLFDYIDARGMDDVECYKNANIDRKTFSKIRCNKHYRPSKQTVVSFAIALHLTLEETNHLLSTVGMTLSRSSKFDVIVSYFIENGKYDIFEINETLFAFDQVLLGM